MVAVMIAVMIAVMVVVRMMRVQNANVRFALLEIACVRCFHDSLCVQNDRFLVVCRSGLVCVDQVGLGLVGQTDGQNTEQTDDVQQD